MKLIKPNSTVLFMGDSITDCGRDYSDINCLGYGYTVRVAKIFNELNPNSNVTFINKGISGNRVVDLISRWEQDCISLKPDFISILIGINDTWRRFDGNSETTAEQYYIGFKDILTQVKIQLPNTKIMIMEPFLLPIPKDRIGWRIDIDPKIQMARKLAFELADAYLPLDGIFAQKMLEFSPDELASDGVHPTDLGNAIIAKEYLKAIGEI